MECEECLTYSICRNQLKSKMNEQLSQDIHNNIYISYLLSVYQKCNLLFEDSKFQKNIVIHSVDDYIIVVDTIIDAFDLNNTIKINEPNKQLINRVITYMQAYDQIMQGKSIPKASIQSNNQSTTQAINKATKQVNNTNILKSIGQQITSFITSYYTIEMIEKNQTAHYLSSQQYEVYRKAKQQGKKKYKDKAWNSVKEITNKFNIDIKV